MAKDLQELHTQNETFRSKTREQERELHRLRPQMETLRSEAHSTKGKHAREMAQACKERDEAIGLAEQIAKDILHERKMNETKEQELVAFRADLHQAKTRLDQHVTKVYLVLILHSYLPFYLLYCRRPRTNGRWKA